MNTKLLTMRMISTAPRYARRKRARFIHRGLFGGTQGVLLLLMVGFMLGVALMKLLSYWGG